MGGLFRCLREFRVEAFQLETLRQILKHFPALLFYRQVISIPHLDVKRVVVEHLHFCFLCRLFQQLLSDPAFVFSLDSGGEAEDLDWV